jgi:hypothetical protein
MRFAAVFMLCTGAALFPFAPAASAIGKGGWDHVGLGANGVPSLNGPVRTLSTDRPGTLLVGGEFTSAGGNTAAARIASWNGTSWSALAGPGILNGAVFAIASKDGKVYAGGSFVNAGGKANADHLAVWSGSGWAPFCTGGVAGPAFTGDVNALQIIGNTLYVGGSFQNAAGIPAADYLVACDLTSGAASALVASVADAISGPVYALAADSVGTLYAGGAFINLNGIPAADYIAAYDGGGVWHALGFGAGPGGGAVTSFVRALAAKGTTIFVGTDAVDVAGIALADHVARWNGSSWSAVGSNTAGNDGWLPASASIFSLATSGSLVIAGGSFQNANGSVAADMVAYFDGEAWHPIGSNGAGNGPIGTAVIAVGAFENRIYAGGAFTAAGADPKAHALAAYALKQPDARIGTAAAGPWTGDAVYSPTAVGEALTQFISRGSSGNFYVNVQNDGLVAAKFKLRGTGGATGYSATYFRGSANITTAVEAGSYSTVLIPPRGADTIRLRVGLANSTTASASYLVEVTSVIGTPTDAVKAIARPN